MFKLNCINFLISKRQCPLDYWHLVVRNVVMQKVFIIFTVTSFLLQKKKNHCKPSPDLEWSRNIFSGTVYSYRFSIGWERGSVLETFLHATKKYNQETIILWLIKHTTLWINDHYFPYFYCLYSHLFFRIHSLDHSPILKTLW